MPQRTRVKVRITWYAYEKREYGGVVLGVLVPIRTYESEEVGDPLQVMLSIVEATSRKSQGDYFEVEVEGGGAKRIMGEAPKYRAQRMLFPRPARLLRVGLLRKGMEPRLRGAGYAGFSKDDLEWITPSEEVYVYEGVIQAPEDVIAVYLETSEGGRLVFNPTHARRLRDVLLPPATNGRAEDNEGGEGGGSNP
ncbi:MAG: hypothetical protein F7C37_06620 [Desulfurococcales archaeon]|nr:hypothetical protein [Desulfurococcales archaeon]